MTLYRYCFTDVVLAACVDVFSTVAGDGVAILYSPKACRFAKLSQGRLTGPDGNAVDHDDAIYEARLFNDAWELRWFSHPGGATQGVLLGEQEIPPQTANQTISTSKGEVTITDFVGAPETESVIDTMDQTYLLWGEPVPGVNQPGWIRLAAARVGAMDVPATLSTDGRNKRLQLEAVEYLAEKDDGNVIVVDEILTGFALAQ